MVHPVRYTLTPASPEAHLFHITCRVAAPDPAGQRFTLPTWIPGSYLIREFARQVVSIQAQADGKPVALTKLDKHSWQAAPVKPGRALEVSYQVYAWDLSVRGAHLDRSHAYFNGPSVFLGVVGQEHLPCRVELAPPAGKAYQDWRVATAMRPAKGERGQPSAGDLACMRRRITTNCWITRWKWAISTWWNSRLAARPTRWPSPAATTGIWSAWPRT